MEAIAHFLSVLLSSRTQAHIFHWRTSSFAAHEALGHYYDSIGDLVDSYAEQVQGCYGLISGFRTPDRVSEKAEKESVVAYFEELKDRVEALEKELPQEPDLVNTYADILRLLHTTIYKLSHLS